MCSSYAFKVLQNLVTKTVVQVSQPYAIHEAALAVYQSGSVLGKYISSMKYYNEQRNINRNILVAESTIQRTFVCEKFGSDKDKKNSFLVIKKKKSKHWCYG